RRIMTIPVAPLARRREPGLDRFHHRLLALEAADAGGGAALPHPFFPLLAGVHLVQFPHRAFLGIAGVAALHARRVGRHGADLLRHRFRILAQRDSVAVGLRHLLAVETWQIRRLGELHLGRDTDVFAVVLYQ